MKKSNRATWSWVPLACLLVAAVLVALLAPATPAQRTVVLSVVGMSLAWLVVLFVLLARTPEGQGRLRSSPPVAVDLLSVVPLIACIFLVGAVGSSGSGDASSLVGPAAGAVLMVPSSFTVRWVWWEHKRRRAPSPRLPAGD